MIPVLILAGGLATRIRPLTEKIPKSLISIAGEPFIFHQLRYLRRQRIEKIVICLGYLGEMIQELVGDGSKFGLEVDYSFDGEVLLGTGGAIVKALPKLSDSFFILYGDSFLPINFQEIYDAYCLSNKPGLMTIIRNEDSWDRSNVVFENHQLVTYDKKKSNQKMKYIDYGLSILKKDTFNSYGYESDKSFFDLADLFTKMAAKRELQGFEVHERFYEVGSFQGIEDINIFIKENENGIR